MDAASGGYAWMIAVVGGPVILAALIGYGIMRSRRRGGPQS
jgi:hypothetical protein